MLNIVVITQISYYIFYTYIISSNTQCSLHAARGITKKALSLLNRSSKLKFQCKGGVPRDFDLIGLLSKLLEPYTKEFKPTQGVVIFIAILVCVTFTIPSVLLHIQRMRELDNEYTRDRWAHEEALADDEIESRKLDIEENKAHAETERFTLQPCWECEVEPDDLRSESAPKASCQNLPPS